MYWILLYFYSNIFILLSVFDLIYKQIYAVGGPSRFQLLPIPCPDFWGAFMSCPENTPPWEQGGAIVVLNLLVLLIDSRYKIFWKLEIVMLCLFALQVTGV
jgi:hypothetical protein